MNDKIKPLPGEDGFFAEWYICPGCGAFCPETIKRHKCAQPEDFTPTFEPTFPREQCEKCDVCGLWLPVGVDSRLAEIALEGHNLLCSGRRKPGE